MPTIKDLLELLKLTPKTHFIIAVICALLLFFPQKQLPFNIMGIRDKYGLLIFIIFLVSTMISFSHFIQVKWETYRVHKNRLQTLKKLTNSEKKFLAKHVIKREQHLLINQADPIAKLLEGKRIIARTGNISTGDYTISFPGSIQPWAYDILLENPTLLEIKNER